MAALKTDMNLRVAIASFGPEGQVAGVEAGELIRIGALVSEARLAKADYLRKRELSDVAAREHKRFHDEANVAARKFYLANRALEEATLPEPRPAAFAVNAAGEATPTGPR
jgi:hypothetical protein